MSRKSRLQGAVAMGKRRGQTASGEWSELVGHWAGV